MNTDEIRSALNGNPVTATCFRGVFSADQWEKALAKLPGGYVINTDPSHKPGIHWVAVYQDTPGVLETFDSFGKTFASYGFASDSHRFVGQTQRLQSSESTVCGQYCMFFLLQRIGGKSYTEILHLFSEDRKSNDKMVCGYVNHSFDLKTSVQDKKFLLVQFAKAFSELN
jgi:hypothetical protein